MIGKKEWFKRRKYGGWGYHPKTWQGWAYVAAIFIPFIAIQSIASLSNGIRMKITLLWLAIVLIDGLSIMVGLKKDEREEKIEAIAERNAAWTMVVVLALGVLYEATTSALMQSFYVDPFLVVALFAGLIVKTASNVYLERKT